MSKFKYVKWFLVSIAVVILTACGGGGGGPSGENDGNTDGTVEDNTSVIQSNTPPVAKSVAIDSATDITIDGIFDVSDTEDTHFKYYVVSQPMHGMVVVSEDNQRFVYTPQSGYVGTDTFTYKAFDGLEYSNEATVTLMMKQSSIVSTDTVPPSKAMILSINSPSSNQITLYWLGSSDDVTAGDDLVYEVHCSTDANFTASDVTKKVSVKGALEADLVNLEEDTLYYVKIKTIDSGSNEAISNEINITTSSSNAIVLNTSNIVKTADDLYLHDAVTTDTTITYTKTDKSVVPDVGDILVGDSQSRTLKKVAHTELKDGEIIITTEDVAMDEVFESLKLDTKTVLYDPNQLTSASSQKLALKKFKRYSYNAPTVQGYEWGSGKFKIEKPALSSRQSKPPSSFVQSNKNIGTTGAYVIISSNTDEKITVTSGEALSIDILASLNTGSDTGFDEDDSHKVIEEFELVSVTHDGVTDYNNFGFSMDSKWVGIGEEKGTVRFIATDARASTKPYIVKLKATAAWLDITGFDSRETSSEEVEIEVTVLTKELDSTEGFRLSLEDDGDKTTFSFPILPNFTLPNKEKHNHKVKATAGVNIDFTPTLVTELDIDESYVKVLLGGKMTFELDSSFDISGELTKTYDFDLSALDKKFFNVYAAGPIPVYQEIDISWKMQIIPSTKGSINVSNKMTKAFNVNFGIECNAAGCSDLTSSDSSSSYTAQVDVGAEASLEVRLIPEVKISFYTAASAALTVEPWVKAGVAAEGSAEFVSDFNNYDAWLSYSLDDLTATVGLDSYVYANLKVFKWELYKYPEDEPKKRLFGVRTDIFSLPTLGMENVEDNDLIKDKQITIQAQAQDGVRTNVDKKSIQWLVYPSYGATIDKDVGDPLKANFSFSEFGVYKVYFVANSSQIPSTFGQQRAEITVDARDLDGDLMADKWEEANGLNPVDASEGSADKDGDGYSNLLEYQHGTNPDDDTEYPDVPKDIGDHDAPVFTSAGSVNVNENQTSAMTLTATDTSVVTYSISDTVNFDVDSVTGEVTFKNAPDYEVKTSYEFTATARDEAGNEATQNVTITILDVDETVPDNTAPVVTVLGDNPLNVTLGTNYVDAGATATDEREGNVNVVVTQDVDTSTLGSYTVTYTASDSIGNEATATRTVYVVEVANSLPTAKITTDTTTLVEGEEIVLSASQSIDPDGGGLSYKWVHVSGGDLANAILGNGETLTLNAQNLKNVGAHTIGLTVTDQDGDINSTTINITLEGANSNSLLSDTVIQWEEDVNSTYVDSTSYKHRYMLALYEDTSCRLVNLNMEIEKQNEDKKTLYENTNKIYTPDTALEETSSCTWSNSSDLLTLSFYDGNQVTNIPLVNGELRVGDVMDSECDESNGCKVTKLSPIDTMDKNAISSHALEIFMADGTVATWNFREDNSVKIYNEGNSTIQFDGNWTLSDSYLSILNNEGSTILRANNLTYRTVDLIDFTSIKGYISDIQVLAPLVSGTSAIKKTGQTKSYDTNGDEVTDGSIRDDGYYQTGVTPSYTRDDSTEVVTDHITGLQWQDDVEAQEGMYGWATAQAYCTALSLDGGRWRLPSRAELRGLAEYGRSGLAINPAFINVASYYYWSSTTFAGKTNYAWIMNFSNGILDGLDKNSDYFGAIVRCVRAGQ
ncbi:DUF1566 domain-containing protein [Sulfurovum sp.]|uniref:Lcl domain-containing protein n=1 Tax=Sulfurovum sp. TaxID=1969726 RepID=UPI0025CFEF83|nr:DUF1566 domain-containing protein [Sulfurovum sp.]